MRRLLLFFCTLCIAFALRDTAAGAAPASPRMRLLVTPFTNGAAAQSQSAYSLGIAAALAERFEDDATLDIVNGPLVLTREQAALVTPDGRHYDLAAANALALTHSATHFLTGRFSGQVWKWTLDTDLYAAHSDGPVRVGHGTVLGDLNEPITTASGRTLLVQSAKRLHAMLATTARAAFAEAGYPLAADTVKAIETPSTNDSFAFLKLSRAYVRYFMNVDDASGDTAIGIAEYAVRVDPTYAEAQRFYATLLLVTPSLGPGGQSAGQTKKARIHFEFAIQNRPKDVRSLVALAKLEIGEKNPDIAKGYLERAIVVRPKDADPHYWLGRALIDLKQAGPALRSFETARDLDPNALAPRRELTQLYSDAKRYVDAAGELAAIVLIDPRDIEARFLLAASWRAAGNNARASGAYTAAVVVFPKDARLHKFLGDLFLADGRTTEARREYAAAVALAPSDRRARALAKGESTSLIGGAALEDAITQATNVAAQMEMRRTNFALAMSDALLDLQLNKERGCLDGHAASSAILARNEGKLHAALGGTLADLTSAMKTASTEGEWAALTSDERARASKALDAMMTAEKDVREMRGGFDRQLLPLYRSFKCETYDGPLTAATIEDVERHMLTRTVVWPPVKPPLYMMSFTPQIAPESARPVMYTVDNRSGAVDRVLTVDGVEVGTILARTSMTFATTIGLHHVCLVPKGVACDKIRDDRLIELHEGWTIRVRPAN